jgi:hypothetical protein
MIRSIVTVIVIALVGCGSPEESSEGAASSGASTTVDAPAISTSIAFQRPEQVSLTVVDDCARVESADGSLWAESCEGPSLGRPLAIKAQATHPGELALIRVFPDAVLTSTSDPGIRVDQRDGWLLIESPTSDFVFTLRVPEQVDAETRVDVACVYNPFFIDCDPV